MMNIKRSPQTEVLLQQLFSGDGILQQRALRAVPAHEQEQVRELVKVRQDAKLLFEVLLADLKYASGEMRTHSRNQFWRRTAIRALVTTVDGMIFSLKKVALSSSPLVGARLDAEDMDFLREQRCFPQQGKVRLPGFRDNFKKTFHLFAKAFGISCPTDFGQKGFEALCETLELRHRITHPKSFMTFCVKDEERIRAGVAIDWLGSEFERLLSATHEGLGKTLSTTNTVRADD